MYLSDLELYLVEQGMKGMKGMRFISSCASCGTIVSIDLCMYGLSFIEILFIFIHHCRTI